MLPNVSQEFFFTRLRHLIETKTLFAIPPPLSLPLLPFVLSGRIACGACGSDVEGDQSEQRRDALKDAKEEVRSPYTADYD